jgi:hypothetical protein
MTEMDIEYYRVLGGFVSALKKIHWRAKHGIPQGKNKVARELLGRE